MSRIIDDYNAVKELLDKNNIPYRDIDSYDENNKACPCIWLDTGHIEFNEYGMITNIVTY